MRPLFTLLLLLSLCHAGALEVREARWGFDGRILQERFNPLSLLITNSEPGAFEGDLVLEEKRGLDQSVGAPIVQPIYIGPYGSRTVQLYPWVSGNGEWKLSWGKKGRYDLPQPKAASPARVILVEADSAILGETHLPIFPDDLFPPTVSATDGLDAVVLDHVPRWELTRREAFLDWVRRGGTLHLIQDSKGVWPAFTGELAGLNGTEESTRLGSGFIRRHPLNRAAITPQFLAAHGSPERESRQGSNIRVYEADQSLLQNLATLTRPEILWWIIYLLAFTYLLIIGPGHFQWGKKWSYRTSIIFFLSVVVVYALAFMWAGRRGKNETQRVHSLSIARALGGNRYDVSQWDNAFVTHGALYKLTHLASSSLYSVGIPMGEQSVSGRIQNGRDGYFAIDLPLYSSRPFMHRAVMQGEPTDVQVQKWETEPDGQLKALELEPGPGFPKTVDAVYARDSLHVYTLKPVGTRWELTKAETAATFFESIQLSPYMGRNSPQTTLNEDEWMRTQARVLMARESGGAELFQHYLAPPKLVPGELQLFIYSKMPESLRLQGGDFRSERGWVLYERTLLKP